MHEYILLAVLLLPILFINVKDSHNWGGDFALYILQARNLVQGKAQTASGYIFNDQGFLPSPQTYPVGFPILLAPLYFFFGNNILAFSYFIAFILFLLGLVIYHLFRHFFSRPVPIASVLLLIYNPWTLQFKGEVLADLPFMLFMMLAVSCFLRSDPLDRPVKKSVLLGSLTAFSMLLKSVGIVLLAAIIVDALVQAAIRMSNGEKKSAARLTLAALTTVGSCLLFYTLVAFVLIPTGQEPLSFYRSLYDLSNLPGLALNAFKLYVQAMRGFFFLTGGIWKILALATIVLGSTLLAIGFIRKFLRAPGLPEWLTLAYSLAVLTFPTANQGLRYLFPIMPFYIYLIIHGAHTLFRGRKAGANGLLMLLIALCLLHYPVGYGQLLREKGKTTIGPQEKTSMETFRFIRENTARNAIFVFIKATVLPLYTGRSCLANRRDQDIASMAAQFEQIGVDYFLINSDLANPALDKYLAVFKDRTRLVWSNEKFRLYEKIN